MLNLKGKRRARPTTAKDRKRTKKLLLDLPQANPTEPIHASEELGLKKQEPEPTYEIAKGEAIRFSESDSIQQALQSTGQPQLVQQDIATEKPAPTIKNSVDGVGVQNSFLSKNDLIQINTQHVESERLGDASMLFGPVNELFWERLRQEVKGAVRKQESDDHLNFEAAPLPESVRQRQRKLPSYAHSGASSGYLRF